MTTILIVGINFAPEVTGIGPYTTELAKNLATRGHDVRVLTARPHYPEWRPWEPDRLGAEDETLTGVIVERLTHFIPKNPTNVRRALSELSFGLRAASKSWRDVDLVILPSPALFSAAIILLKKFLFRKSVPVGVIIQDLYSAGTSQVSSQPAIVSRGVAVIEAAVARYSNGVVVIHPIFADWVVEKFGLNRSQVRVIRNWTRPSGTELRPEDRKDVRSLLGWGETEFVVLHTGAMGRKQDLRNVVDASRLASDLNLPVRFVLVGDGVDGQKMREAALVERKLSVGAAVDTELYPRMLKAADLLLVNELPGMRETAVPSKLTSYFHSGVAVLAATDKESATAIELTLSGGGVTVEAGLPDLLLRAVTELRDDPTKRSLLGARGAAYASSSLSAKASLEEYRAWVEDLMV